MKPFRSTVLVMLVLLVIQYVLGMIANLDIQYPAGNVSSWVFGNSPIIVLHIMNGTLLIVVAIVALVLSLIARHPGGIVAAALGLALLVFAWLSGVQFLATQRNDLSLLMALGFMGACIAYFLGYFFSHSKGEKHMETSVQSTGEQPMAIRLLLACGAIGPLLNIVVILILGATRPGYNAWLIPDSNLELGEGGWIQITNYIVCGVLLLGFAIGMRLLLRTGRGSTWGPILLGIYGLTFIVTGIFVTDPVLGYPPGVSSTPTVYGTLHNLFGQLQFISLIAACFVLARRDAADPARRGWIWYSVATGLLIAASDVAFVLAFKLWDGSPVGLIERIGIIGGGSWIALLAIRLMRKKDSIA